MAQLVKLDVREVAPWDRHPLIFEKWEALEVGDELELTNDHNPKPLHYEFLAERDGEFEWQTDEKSPREWVAHIKKIAPPKQSE